jgi:TonB family protein
MDPGNVEFRIDDANILMRMNKDKDAIETLEVALKMAHMPEETAAVENVLQSMKKFVAERARTQHQNLGIRAQASQSGSKGATQAGVQAQSGPRVIYNPEPEYTEEARQARRGGTCSLSLIVGVDGKPRNIVVTKKVGMGLDEKAIEAVGKWKFEPARRYGRPVMARLNLSLNFKVFGDSDRIVELSQRAKIGDAAAEFELANAFFEGREMPKDESQGMALLERAARDGLAQAQFQMGERARGDGSDQNSFVAAYVWYALAQRGGLEQSYTRINELEAKMSAEQLSEAQKRLENWAPATVK